jgi:hypothetical protein
LTAESVGQRGSAVRPCDRTARMIDAMAVTARWRGRSGLSCRQEDVERARRRFPDQPPKAVDRHGFKIKPFPWLSNNMPDLI